MVTIESEDDLIYLEEFRRLDDGGAGQREAAELFRKGASIDAIRSFCKGYENRKIAEEYKKEANLSKRFQKRTFETFDPYTGELETALNKAKKYAELLPEITEDGTNIIFEGHGCVGTGKTHLAYAIANYALDLAIPTKVVNTTQLVDAVSYSSLDKKIKKSLLDVPLLVIDDLGKECGYDWLLFEMYGILNYRYECCKPTVITTEDTISDLRQHYMVKTEDGIKDRGKSIFSRICESVVIVSVQGEDYRLRKK